MPVPVVMPGVAHVQESNLYIKEQAGDAMYAIDLAGPSLKWKRPLSASDTLVRVDQQTVDVLGTDLSSIDLATRTMKWSTKLPIENGSVRAIASGNSMYVFSGRGIFEVDRTNGDPLRIFRGADRQSAGGTMLSAGGRLICVSNLAVTAYQPGDAQAAR
jgi:outer membrane protein assembly factor BamB